MKKYLLLGVLAISACTQNRFLYNNENGQAIYEAECSWGTYGDCLQKAGQQCPTGFNILMSSEQQTGTYTDVQGSASSRTSASASAYGFGNTLSAFGNSFTNSSFNAQGLSSNLYKRYMIYSCK